MSTKNQQKKKAPQKKEDANAADNEEQDPENQQSAEERFEQELNWCIEQIVLGFEHQNPNSKQAYEAVKVLKILRSDKAPMIKKRQAMRNAFGDYRQKMKAEERKSAAKLKKISLTPVKDIKGESSSFYKKSVKKQGKSSDSKDDDSEIDTAGEATCSTTNDVSNISKIKDELCTESKFKFAPSSNSFAFNFGSEQNDSECVCSEGDLCNKTEERLVITDSDQNRQRDSNDLCEPNKNYYKITKSDNTFQFNFQLPDS